MITKVRMSNGKWAVLWSATILKTFDTEAQADAYMVGMERKVAPVARRAAYHG
jgi:hypothetical protein